jgi:hypothetical protein
MKVFGTPTNDEGHANRSNSVDYQNKSNISETASGTGDF